MSHHDSDIVPADGDRRTLDTLKAIQAGKLDPRTVPPATRRQLVEYFMGEGYPTVEMAKILKVSERTIERDKKSIRQANALQPGPALTDEMAGWLLAEAALSIQHIRRDVRGKHVAPAVKVQAERECFAILSELVQRLQSLGHLPTAAQKVEAAVLHMDGIPSLDEMGSEVRRLRTIAAAKGGDPKMLEQLDQLESDTERARLAARAEEISEQMTETEGDDDEPDKPDAPA